VLNKIVIFISMAMVSTAFAQTQTVEKHLVDSFKSVGKTLEGKKGKVVLSQFKLTNSPETCPVNKGLQAKISSALIKAGVKTQLSSRHVEMDADQTEISRVAKLSGGSYIILGAYELSGTKFKIDCSVFDHNGASVASCEDMEPVTLSPDQVTSFSCPKEVVKKEEVKEATTEASTETASVDHSIKAIDDYICSVIHKDYDFKRLINSLFEKKFYTVEELKGIKADSVQDELDAYKENCATLGNFVVCTNGWWPGPGAHIFLSDDSALGKTKIVNWKHPSKSQVKNSSRCLKKTDNWWN
jgi:hypothetical protein